MPPVHRSSPLSRRVQSASFSFPQASRLSSDSRRLRSTSADGIRRSDFTSGDADGNLARMRPSASLRLAALGSLLAAAPLIAQSPIPTSNARVRAALDILKTDNSWTVQQQV